MTPLVSPVTGTGIKLSVVVPFPSSPWELLPQQTAPPLDTAQGEPSPTETEVTPLASPVTCTGVELFVVAPFPSAVEYPQHRTPPLDVNAHAEPPPTETAVTPLVSPVTCTGI